jgi:hypothetical protein
MPLLKRQLTPIDCQKWRKKKEKNPITGYKISPTSIIYKEIEKECKDIKSPENSDDNKVVSPVKYVKNTLLKRELKLEDCQKWINNKTKNPITNYTIKENTPLYNEIKNKCEVILKTNNKDDDKIDKKPKINIINDDKDIKKDSIVIPVINKKDDNIDIDISVENDNKQYYPDINDDNFKENISNIKEFNIHKILKYDNIKNIDEFISKSNKTCGSFEKALYQYLMGHYISSRTPYKSLLMYHAVGVGKTCSAITISESFLIPHSIYDEPKIWVVMPVALKNSFKEQIFDMTKIQNLNTLSKQCTGELYSKLLHISKDIKKNNNDKIALKLKKLIKSRYKIFTYDSFATFLETEYISKNLNVKDKVIIIDEAHNIRSSDNINKRVYTILSNVLKDGINNRLVLLSATPMYNEPSDIFDLLYLLLINDKREDLLNIPYPKIFNDKNEINKNVLTLLKQLSSNYISYLRGKNPFSFALKLSPKDSGIKILDKIIPNDNNGNPIPKNDSDWLIKIKDGIVPANIGEKQLKFVNNLKDIDESNVFNHLQPMNIVYDDDIGEKGFFKIFTRINDKEPINVKYNKKYNNMLFPSEEHLAKCSGKFLNICNIIKKTKGVIVIYSRYIWSGILPLAICLEHMGFNREGTTNFLNEPTFINDLPKYDNIKIPKYCILSSDNNEVMGNTKIDGLLKLINSPKNIDGSVIKVILMTPVAGEGLSFYNIREMHLIEPWYHFNRVDQVIGRGIRNCSHQDLPINEKNVTVFMHACIDNYINETPDIHAFRIASRKLNQSDKIDEIIRDNSLDCILMKNINYFPKSLFELGKIILNTSQNKKIEYLLGDDEILEPKCIDNKKKLDERGFRKETFKHLIPSIKNILRNLILNKLHNGERFIEIKYILDNIQFDKEIIIEGINSSVYPNILIDGYILLPHKEGLHIINIVKENPKNIRIINSIKQQDNIDNKSVDNKFPSNEDVMMKKINKLNKDNNIVSTIALYSSIVDSNTWTLLAKKLIELTDLDETNEYIVKLLYNQGALILNKELQSFKNDKSKIIGYIDIFNIDKFDAVIYINNKYRDLTDRELKELLSVRIEKKIPDMSKETIDWGLISPVFNKDDKNTVNIFKLLTAGVSVGKKTGIVCTSLKKNNHVDILKKMGITDDFNTKIGFCNAIAKELFKIDRLTIYPIYKPTIPF